MRYETAESVTAGHPDKLCDIIADNILEECMAQDPDSRVACEVMLSHEVMMIAGEITTKAKVDYQAVAERVIKDVGYEPPNSFVDDIVTQSPDIKQAVDGSDAHEQGAGDQGIVYGYSTTSTLSKIPLAADLAHRLTDAMMREFYERKAITGLGPDGKAQVTVAHEDGSLDHIANVLVSIQHAEDKNLDDLRQEVENVIIKPALADFDLSRTEIIINPSGRFVKGGFEADTGLTGRKLMVDSYGGLAHHGGGAFSGKDPSKVDRSGAYMARYIANVITEAGLSKECEVSIAYAIGRSQPTAIEVQTSESGLDGYITGAVKKVFNLTPASIAERLRLKKFINYAATAKYGHFGAYKDYPWEKVDPLDVRRIKEVLCEDVKNSVLDGLKAVMDRITRC